MLIYSLERHREYDASMSGKFTALEYMYICTYNMYALA